MKKELGVLLMSLTMVATSLPVLAQSTEPVAKDGGGLTVTYSVKQQRSSNHATPGGGDWYWGYTKENGKNILYSSYSHKTLRHSATVITDHGKDKKYRDPDGTFNRYATAEKESTGGGTDKVYWNTY